MPNSTANFDRLTEKLAKHIEATGERITDAAPKIIANQYAASITDRIREALPEGYLTISVWEDRAKPSAEEMARVVRSSIPLKAAGRYTFDPEQAAKVARKKRSKKEVTA